MIMQSALHHRNTLHIYYMRQLEGERRVRSTISKHTSYQSMTGTLLICCGGVTDIFQNKSQLLTNDRIQPTDRQCVK